MPHFYIEDTRELDGLTPQVVLPRVFDRNYTAIRIERGEEEPPQRRVPVVCGFEYVFDAAWDVDPASFGNHALSTFKADRFILARKALGANSKLFHLFCHLYEHGHRHGIAADVLLYEPFVQEIRRTVGQMYDKYHLALKRYFRPMCRRHHSEVGNSQLTNQKPRDHKDSVRVWLCPEEAARRKHYA